MTTLLAAAAAVAYIVGLFAWPRLRRHLVKTVDATRDTVIPEFIIQILKDWIIPHIQEIWTAAFALLVALFGLLGLAERWSAIWSWAQADPPLAAAIILGGALFLSSVCWWFLIRQDLTLGRGLRGLGFKKSWSSVPHDVKEEPWPSLISDIVHKGNKIVWICGANGKDTFADPEAGGLYNALDDFKGKLRVLILKPNCTAMKKRAGDASNVTRKSDIKAAVEEYRAATELSIQRLNSLKTSRSQHPPLVLWHTYEEAPSWKLIITSGAAWVQYYMPGMHVNKTPIYRFEPTESCKDFYYLYKAEFRRKWLQYGGKSTDVAD